MCLIKKSYIPRIALKDKTVYKIVIPDWNGDCYTPCQFAHVKLGKTYKGIFRYGQTLLKSFFKKEINSGFIHAFTNYDRDEHYKFSYSKRFRIAECVIPKGTLYYEGKTSDIASRKLKYLRIL